MTDRIGADRRILSVIAPHSNSGKTLFIVHLLKSIDGLGCLKISPVHSQHEESEEGDLRSQDDFHFEKPSRLCRPGKDTALYLEAGARQVERLGHTGSGLRAGLEATFKRFSPDLPIVVESSSAVELLDPVAVVLVVRPPIGEMKPATQRVLHRVTDLLVNTSRHDDDIITEAERLCARFPALRPAQTWIADLGSEPPPTEMLTRLARLLSPPDKPTGNPSPAEASSPPQPSPHES